MSLGGDAPSAVELQMTDLLAKKGLLLIAAAGNGGTSAVEYPAGFATVVSVAAVDASKAIASFSTFNADVELSGPGVGVLSTVPIGSQTAGSPRATATGTLADFGLGDTPVAGSMTGKVCLIKRGTITFAAKVVNCQNSGGLGAIIYNNTTGDLPGTLGETVTAIPSVGTTQADGQTMLTQLGQSATVSVFGTDDAYAFYNGTSMATPHVAGVAALVWSHFPHCTADQMRTSLDLHALDLGDPGRDVHFGFGLVQAKTTFDAIAIGGCGK
jgi:subtilisin family serine protease